MVDRIRTRLSAQVEDVPLTNEIVEFTPPEIKSKVATNEGGFVHSEDTVGLEALKWTLKVKGDHQKLQNALGKFMIFNNAQINVTEKGKTVDGEAYTEVYSLYGPITGIKKDAVKMGEKPTVTLEGTCKSYKLTDTGTVVHNINTVTGDTTIGGVDILK